MSTGAAAGEADSGPLSAAQAAALPPPPRLALAAPLQALRFNQRQIELMFRARREAGEVFALRIAELRRPVFTSRPEDVRSLLSASPEQALSTTPESPLAPLLGPDSVLTALGAGHMRKRKLLLPPFHGEAIARYSETIAAAAEREIERWPLGRPFALAPRMAAITLEVIMAGVFGIEAGAARGGEEARLRATMARLLALSTWPGAQLFELMNAGRSEPIGAYRLLLALVDRRLHALIAARRAAAEGEERRDILSLLLAARDEEGEALSDRELRSELLGLLLAGHETTANSLAWAWERLLRNPAAHARLIDAVRTETDAEAVIEQTIVETMRSRPVIPLVGRRVTVPWRLGECAVAAGTPAMISVLLLHHREELYPEPFEFRPERWVGRKPGTYEWLPFGGGIRRCLGAALALAEQRAVLGAMAAHLDLEAAETAPEPALHRNVTMIPRHGARVIVRARLR